MGPTASVMPTALVVVVVVVTIAAALPGCCVDFNVYLHGEKPKTGTGRGY
ncbi:hypothetical protein LI328DRAFT_148181 [Trichoderma asperelloides]|nr:hypothetical protein LI328DRAFT_148181 [Trichoderma asperelloides]